jgi:hypothetical protein
MMGFNDKLFMLCYRKGKRQKRGVIQELNGNATSIVCSVKGIME